MNKILVILVVIVACFLAQACEQDPVFEFQDDGKIYFKYPKKENSLGVATDQLVDSIVYTLHGKELYNDKDTLWLKVEVMGARKDVDRKYKVVVVADSSSAKEGVDIDKLDEFYYLHKNVGVDSFPLVFNKKELMDVFKRSLLLKLEQTDDLGVAFVEYSTLRVNFSAYRLEPEWWWAFSYSLGEYHPLKYDKVVEIYGSEEIDPYGNTPYCDYVGNIVKKYFEDTVVIDPFTGERLMCNM